MAHSSRRPAARSARSGSLSPADIISSAIIARLEAGTAPWRRPWSAGTGSSDVPLRATGEPYRGINTIWLWAVAEAKGFTGRRWMTYRQAQALGGQVRKGETSALAVFYKSYGATNEDPDTGAETRENRRVLKAYHVFNVDQIDGLPDRFAIPAPLRVFEPGEHAAIIDRFRDASGAVIRHGGDQACYMPGLDIIRMPHAADFIDYPHYGATLAHELVHWTGARHRLDRDLKGRFGSDAYGFEELVAEMGAAMVGAELSLPVAHLDHHASYLAAWLKILKADSRAILTAAAKAEQAADHLLRKAGLRTATATDDADAAVTADDIGPAAIAA